MVFCSEQKDPPDSKGITRELVPCPADLKLTDSQLFVLLANRGIPEWAVDACFADFLLQATADPDKRAAVKTWRIWGAQHVVRMWGTPATRPSPSEKPLSPSEVVTLRRQHRAELKASHNRSEAARMAYEAESGPMPDSARRFLASIGMLIPVPAKPGNAATPPGAASPLAPCAQCREGSSENAPAGRSGDPGDSRP